MTTQKQKQLWLGEGFLAGLAALDVADVPHDRDALTQPFMHAWNRWSPRQPAELLPAVDECVHHEPRMIFFRIGSSRSPFRHVADEGIAAKPLGRTPRDFLALNCGEIPVNEWVQLARLFVDELKK